MATDIDITQQVCPASEYGDTHHLIPRYVRGVGTFYCIYCGKSAAELRQ